MAVIARRNGFVISSDFGTAVSEGSVPTGTMGGGRTLTFVINQSPPRYQTLYVEIVPITGQIDDFWDSGGTGGVAGQPANVFTLSAFLYIPPRGRFSVQLNADTLAEADERFQFRIYANATDAGFGIAPLITVGFTILDDDINGTQRADHLIGRARPDYLRGYAGNDTLDGGAGADTMEGGTGDDTYHVDHAGDLVIERAAGGRDLVFASVSYRLPQHVENLALTGTANINATGNNLANRLAGNSGNNILDGGLGADTMTGGRGNDTYRVTAGDVVIEQAGGGIDTVISAIRWTLPAHVEHLNLIGTADIAGTGNALGNRIAGNAGNNVLSGGAGNDTLLGGAGNDRLIGGPGADRLSGGLGADVFAFRFTTDSRPLAAARDVIVDFNRTQGDRIDLSAIDANTIRPGNQAFSFIGSTDFSGRAGELRTIALNGNLFVNGDVDGDGLADFSLQVNIAGALFAGDFIL